MLFDARPRQCRRMLEVADVAGADRRCGKGFDRDHIGGGDFYNLTAFGAHPQSRINSLQVPDHVGQRWHRSGRQSVPQADAGADRR
jgi:hypothetical protein